MAIADKMVSRPPSSSNGHEKRSLRAAFHSQIRAAKILEVPVIATEQRPQGLYFPSLFRITQQRLTIDVTDMLD
jgi:hypothetical protein